ncbi:hypothetical protein GCM10008983_24670 [Lentibacillus halophilus]|uniref:Uncharacterized protein n=1 Tax=Lentibacillus halophilus TaxID=295065 RepID=A0ABP3J916_9BACI
MVSHLFTAYPDPVYPVHITGIHSTGSGIGYSLNSQPCDPVYAAKNKTKPKNSSHYCFSAIFDFPEFEWDVYRDECRNPSRYVC